MSIKFNPKNWLRAGFYSGTALVSIVGGSWLELGTKESSS